MSTPQTNLLIIKGLIDNLPLKDISFAKTFIDKREFPLLQELVDSALYKINKNLTSDNPKEEYKTLNVEAIEELAVKIDEYIIQVYGESVRLNAADLVDDEEDYYENFEEFDLNDLY